MIMRKLEDERDTTQEREGKREGRREYLWRFPREEGGKEGDYFKSK